jgi:Secretion system C-terminal sorting domain
MQKNIFFLLLLVFCTFGALAQTTSDDALPNYCGTTPSKAPWWLDFQRTKAAGQLRGGDSIIYIPMTIHLLGTNDNKGYVGTKLLLEAICQLNADYETAKIQFYVQGEWHRIANTAWDSHKTVKEGAKMMLANNVANTVNIYIVTNPAGNCGYNLPYAGIALNRSCITAGKHTWAHELGHGLSLNHPFLGWEGNKYDYAKPTPTKLTYNYTDFKETYFPQDTLIIDTAFVELMDTSNCSIAADKICDTRPDYINYRWDCDAQNNSLLLQKDPNNVNFYSDGSLFMSYSLDKCQSRFSAGEIAQMRYMVKLKRPEWVHYSLPEPIITAKEVTLLSPTNNQKVQYNNVTLTWEKVEFATQYQLQISRFSNFGFIDFDTLVTLPKASVYKLSNNKTYSWRVRPFNNSSPCTAFSSAGTFEGTVISSVQQLDAVTQCVIFPNPVHHNEQLTLDFESIEVQPLTLRLTDVSGRVLYSESIESKLGKNTFLLPIKNQATGLYFVELMGKTGRISIKIVVSE